MCCILIPPSLGKYNLSMSPRGWSEWFMAITLWVVQSNASNSACCNPGSSRMTGTAQVLIALIVLPPFSFAFRTFLTHLMNSLIIFTSECFNVLCISPSICSFVLMAGSSFPHPWAFGFHDCLSFFLFSVAHFSCMFFKVKVHSNVPLQ